MMVAFIDRRCEGLGVEPICDTLPIAPSTYYASKARSTYPEKRSARAKRDETLKKHIQKVWDENFSVYGARKVWLQLVREGIKVA